MGRGKRRPGQRRLRVRGERASGGGRDRGHREKRGERPSQWRGGVRGHGLLPDMPASRGRSSRPVPQGTHTRQSNRPHFITNHRHPPSPAPTPPPAPKYATGNNITAEDGSSHFAGCFSNISGGRARLLARRRWLPSPWPAWCIRPGEAGFPPTAAERDGRAAPAERTPQCPRHASFPLTLSQGRWPAVDEKRLPITMPKIRTFRGGEMCPCVSVGLRACFPWHAREMHPV